MGTLKLYVEDSLAHIERENGEWSVLSIGASYDGVVSDVQSITADLRSYYLTNGIPTSEIIDLDNAVPASSQEQVAIVREELGSEYWHLVTIHLQSSRVHGADELFSDFIVDVDAHVFSGSREFQTIRGPVTSIQ